MSEEPSLLETLVKEQTYLVSNDQLVRQQMKRQEHLTWQMTEFSQTLICDLRLLSLVRAKIIKNTWTSVKSIAESQTFKGLKFAVLQYCPSFIDANKLNHYMYFIAYLRRNCDVLALMMYRFALKRPEKLRKMAFSSFLTLFQQGWCIEEDNLISKVLCHMATYQFGGDEKPEPLEAVLAEPRKLKLPRSAPEVALASIEPFATFSSSYMFNGASLAYLQSALAPSIIKLHSLSHLRDKVATFEAEVKTGASAPVGYWREMCDYALTVFNSLHHCLEMLPPGVFKLFRHLKELNIEIDLKLIFFEGFINRALDNPAVLGLLPWHPSHGGWHPSHDIAEIFRSKYTNSLVSKSTEILGGFLKSFESYAKIDLDVIIEKLCTMNADKSSLMISETELLSTNPNFPKELLISGRDLCIMHEAAIASEIDTHDMHQIIERMKDVPQKNSQASEHFKVVIIRQKETTTAAKEMKHRSLFSLDNIAQQDKGSSPKDHYGEKVCDVIASIPSLERVSECMNITEPSELFERLYQITPFFLDEEDSLMTDSVMWYALANSQSISDLIERITKVAQVRDSRSIKMADRTAALRTQYLRVRNALDVVRDIRKNVQSHILLQVASIFMENEMRSFFIEAMAHGHDYLSDVKLFSNDVISMTTLAKSKLQELGVPHDSMGSIVRILFFKLTEHIAFGRFCVTNPENWKRSVILTSVIEKYSSKILDDIFASNPQLQGDRMRYLMRASDMLGHIRTSSGVSVLIHTVLEAIGIVQTLCDACDDANMDACLLVVMATTKAKHLYLISKFLQHFIMDPLSNGTLEFMFTGDEIATLGILPSAVLMLVNVCSKFSEQIAGWNKPKPQRKVEQQPPHV